jgi:lysozyme
VLLLLLAVVGAAGYWVWFPRWKPHLESGERLGVDVSAFQGSIDWQRVHGSGMSFAYLKATEGGDFVDHRFGVNWAETGRVGLPRGAYHFFTFCRDAREQAEHFLATVPDDPWALAPAVDLELAGNCAARPDVEVVREQLAVFLRAVEARSTAPTVLYVGRDFLDRYEAALPADRPLWVRRLLLRPSTPGWDIWQASHRADVPGIEGGVDLDVAR